MRKTGDGNSKATNTPRQVLLCELDRHGHRILRLLHLRHVGGAGLPEPIFSPPIRRLPRYPRWQPSESHSSRRRSAQRFLAISATVWAAKRRSSHRCSPWECPQLSSACCRPITQSGWPLRCFSRFAGSVRVLASVASGAAQCSSPPRTHRPESAPGHGMFPQLGAPLGFLFSNGIFLLLSRWLSDEQFFTFGWRIPFLASAVLVVVGLYVRLKISETPSSGKRSPGTNG